jgi:hypothetical protein
MGKASTGESYIEHARSIADECRYVAAALNEYAHRIRIQRNYIRILNFVVSGATLLPPTIWLATRDTALVQAFGQDFPEKAMVIFTIIAFMPALLLLGGTAYFTAHQPEAPDRVRDWGEYLVLYADWIEELCYLRPRDIRAKLEIYISLANINLNHASTRWNVARDARSQWRASPALRVEESDGENRSTRVKSASADASDVVEDAKVTQIRSRRQ